MKAVLITGGARFIGTNLADRFLSNGQPVIVLDDLSRPGVENNLRYLQARHGDSLQTEIADVRDRALLDRIVPHVSAVYHFAAQTAVTTSMVRPELDFDINARGTLQLLEAIRACTEPPMLLYTSTNKVYGGLEDVRLRKSGRRYEHRGSARLGRSTSTRRTAVPKAPQTSTCSTTRAVSRSRSPGFG